MYIYISGYSSASLGIYGSFTALKRSFLELFVFVVYLVYLVATVDAFPTLFYLFKFLYFKIG
jgi:hypothetical protein